MQLTWYDDATPQTMAALIEEALPADHTTLLLIHLALFRQAGTTILERLRQAGRPGSIGEQVLRYHHADGSHDTAVVTIIHPSGAALPDSFRIGDISLDDWSHVWPADRPHPGPETEARWIAVAALDE